MPYETVRYNRDDLYEQVWSQPMSKLAKSYGLSDVGLAKICKKLKIPVPARGFWAKKAHGKIIHRPSLPSLEGSEGFVLRVAKRGDLPVTQGHTEEVEAKITFEQLNENQIQVSPALLSPHPYVARAEKNLRNARRNSSGILSPLAKKCLDLQIGPNSLDRALRIMDALIKALESRGINVSISEEGNRATSVSVLGETLQFGIEETLNRTERELTKAQKKEKEKYAWLYNRPQYDYSPSGSLVLKIKSSEGRGFRRTWSDGKKQRVEDALNSFIVGLIKAAEAIKAERLERERWKREWQEKERQREEMARLRREEEERLQSLDKQVVGWHKSRQIRAYIEAVRQAAIQKHGQIAEGSQLDQWLTWANQQADRIDPLSENSPSTLDEEVDKISS